MRKSATFTALLSVTVLAVPAQAFAKDVDPVGSTPESSTTQPFAGQPPTTPLQNSRVALEYAKGLLEGALESVSHSNIPSGRKEELRASLRGLLDRVKANQLPEKSELESALAQVAAALAAPTSSSTQPPAPPSSGQPTSSIPPQPSTTTGRGSGESGRGSGGSGRGSTPSTSNPTPPPNAMPLSQIVQDALSKVAASNLDAATKTTLTAKLQSIIDSASAGKIPPTSEIEQTLRQVASALGVKDPSKLNQPSGHAEENNDEPGHDSAPPAQGSSDPSVVQAAPGRGGSSQPRSSEKSRADLVEKLQEVLGKLQAMPASPETESAKTLVSSLLGRIQNGEMVPQDEVRSAMDQVKTIAFARLGREKPREEVEPAEAPTQEHLTQRMAGAVSEALNQLQNLTTPDATTATAALSAIQDKLVTGAVVTKDEFEQAMRLARVALGAKPGARASVTLAGIINQLENSNAPEEAKAEMLDIIKKALEQAQQNPDADLTQAVKDAIEQARAARIAAAVEKLRGITDSLTADATAAGSTEALLILADVVAVLNPTDGSTPTRDQLHEARSTLEQVMLILHPEAAEAGPAQETTAPSVTDVTAETTLDTSPQTTTSP